MEKCCNQGLVRSEVLVEKMRRLDKCRVIAAIVTYVSIAVVFCLHAMLPVAYLPKLTLLIVFLVVSCNALVVWWLNLRHVDIGRRRFVREEAVNGTISIHTVDGDVVPVDVYEGAQLTIGMTYDGETVIVNLDEVTVAAFEMPYKGTIRFVDDDGDGRRDTVYIDEPLSV